jgi:hypothetical protein
MAFFRGYERVGGRPLSGERVRGVPLFSARKKKTHILSNFGHFMAQKVLKYSKKTRKTAVWGRFRVF